MLQSQLSPFIQLSSLCFMCSGYQCSSFAARRKCSFLSRYLMYHCFECIISIGVPDLSPTLTVWMICFCPTSSFACLRSSMMAFLASSIFRPSYLPALSFILPFLVMTILSGRLCFLYHSMSVWSPNVQHMTIPVPFSGSAFSSGRIGTVAL